MMTNRLAQPQWIRLAALPVWIAVGILTESRLWSQPAQIQIQAPAPQPVTAISATAQGQTGQTSIWYWVAARYGSGMSIPTGPARAVNTVGIPNLSPSSSVIIGWTAMPGATGYDVIRSSTANYPASPTCADCAVVLNTPNNVFSDTGGATFAFPAVSPAGQVIGTWSIDNISQPQPYLGFALAGTTVNAFWRAVMTPGTPTNGRCAQWEANGILGQASAACGSGSGGTPGGADGDIQYNNAGTFGGRAGTANQILRIPGGGGGGQFGSIDLSASGAVGSSILGVPNGGTGLASGTSGGILGFTATGVLASSGALTANLPLIGGGAGATPTVGTRSGNTTQYVTTTGAQTSGRCVEIDANGNHIAASGACSNAAAIGGNFDVIRTSSSVLTYGGSCSAGAPCRFEVGPVVYSITASGTLTVAGAAGTGSVWFQISSAGALQCRHNLTDAALTVGGTVACTKVSGATGFTTYGVPIWIFTATEAAGVTTWDAGTGTDQRTPLRSDKPLIGTGCIAITENSGDTTIDGSSCGGITGSGASGQVAFFTGASVISSNSTLTWDNTNKILSADRDNSGAAGAIIRARNTNATLTSQTASFAWNFGSGGGQSDLFIHDTLANVDGAGAARWQCLFTPSGNCISADALIYVKSSALNYIGLGAADRTAPPTSTNNVLTRTGTVARTHVASGTSQSTTPVLSVGTFTDSRFDVLESGLVGQYRDIATAGQGLASVYAVVASTGNTASISTTNLQCGGAVCAAGVYRVSVYIVVTTAGSAGTADVNIGWNDGTAARTETVVTAIALNATNYANEEIIVRADGTNNITYAVPVTGLMGATFAIYVTLERMQ